MHVMAVQTFAISFYLGILAVSYVLCHTADAGDGRGVVYCYRMQELLAQSAQKAKASGDTRTSRPRPGYI
jgi:hypothetical protein